MLSVSRLKELCEERQLPTEQLAEQLVSGRVNKQKASAAIENWKKGLFKPIPRKEDIRNLAAVLSVAENDLTEWCSSYRYAPGSARKARLVTQLIVGRSVQEALDILKFTKKRAATMIEKILKTAVADADEQQADVDNLYVSEARADGAGVRIGTKRWIPKDRGRAHPLRKSACHIYITVREAG